MTSSSLKDIENLCTLFDTQTDLTAKPADGPPDPKISSSGENPGGRSLTVSTLAHYFGLQCGEYLRLSMTRSVDSNENDHLRSSLTKQRGISFEETLRVHHASSILSDIHDETAFLLYLRQSLAQPDDFRIGYNVKFRWTYDEHLQSNYKPDFLLIRPRTTAESRLEITIADAKSSLRMAIEHCVQVTLYAIDLRVWLERHQLDEQVFINDIGEIWIPSDDAKVLYEVKRFPLRKLRSRLEDFLRYDLDRILTDSHWMMLPRCALCSFAGRCRQRAKDKEPTSINNLAYLSPSVHALIRSAGDLQDLFESSANEKLSLDERMKFQKILSINPETRQSAMFEALRTHQPQLKTFASSLLPRVTSDLRLLFIFILPNPSRLHSVALFAYNIFDISDQSWRHSRAIVETYPSSLTIVSLVARALGELRGECQIVLFDEQERNVLFEQLTLGSASEQIAECLALLTSTENAIRLDHPPDIVQSDRLFRSHALSTQRKEEIERELLEHYDVQNTKKVNKPELVQQLKQLNEQVQEKARQTLVGLPFLICLHSVIRQSFVVPIPGYFNLEDLKESFGIDFPSSNLDAILDSISSSESVDRLVQERLAVLARLYSIVQDRLSQSNRLQFHAYPLPAITPILSTHSHIRRLVFLRQYEMLHSLRSFQQSRFEISEPPIVIRVRRRIPVDQYNTLWECQVERGEEMISKNFTENTNDFRTYPYLIFREISSIRTFCDALYMDSAIDGLRSAKKFDQLGLVNVEEKGEDQKIIIRIKLSYLSLKIDEQYGLSERYVDFNTKKAIHGLERATDLTVQILDDPRQLEKPKAIQQVHATLQQQISNMFSKREPSIKPEGLHLLNRAQQDACEQVKNERITLIWGPPGTGKTYWSGVTVFQMLMFSSTPIRILITACTHTAIDNLLGSIEHLKTLFSNSPQFPQWCELATNLVLLKLDSTNLRQLSSKAIKSSTVVGSTVWTLQKLDEGLTFDVIFVDEATQLLTSDAVLALNRLSTHRESRLIVAGDPLQLPPVKRCVYPPLPFPVPDLFSSLFHCLLRDKDNHPISLETEKPFDEIARCPYLSVFNENHRMNEQLSDFTRLLYGEHYRQGRTRPLLAIRSIPNDREHLLGPLLDPSSSLYTLLIDSPSSSLSVLRSADLDLESRLVASLVNELVQRLSLSSIFIITPHRMQRSAIRQRLSGNSLPNVTMVVDTVERMQGKEAQCVILCMLYREREMLDNELDFIYNRQRINVSITRAQQLCILLTSELLYNQPPFNLFINQSTRNAYTLLGNYVAKSVVQHLDERGRIKQ